MKSETIISKDNKKLVLYKWDEVNRPLAVIQLVHGSCEHIKRYQDFISKMNQNNVIVVGIDQRGHGQTSVLNKELGYFNKTKGWDSLVEDQLLVNQYIKTHYSDLPIYMFGHSMGSFVARSYAIKYSDTIKGLILSGTNQTNSFVLTSALFLTYLSSLFIKAKKPNKFIWNLSYKQLNKKFNSKTSNGVEWLTRDTNIQNKFLKDKYCGFVFSSSAFKDMFKGMLFNLKTKNLIKMNKDLRILLLTGSDDPVSNYSKDVIKFNNKLEKLGYNSQIIIYPQFRHEILNELDKNVVINDILKFM
ncbi:lysophospholipase [Mycoplasma feriruminatoris]|uniref:Monoacylglycerol lipase n=1 Tax=Mycoplasma feriruminatoris TaxID=1179777 RepID=A0A654ILV4_9MOLU|nr:alpha/beta hydrolase [Mycoplasma feriruminatoris]WFQ90500.1 Monoacylglycerol lipase [Mycoplasma feriruminatoris]WFQ91321.1 lysophospholipase [Mycoplasma feriruminatoris]VZR98525.1 Monoacylglycerol lipase [Mycoplasma feriruminatoris]